jgi:hypothetical protein
VREPGGEEKKRKRKRKEREKEEREGVAMCHLESGWEKIE